jgi:hypothetical protein
MGAGAAGSSCMKAVRARAVLAEPQAGDGELVLASIHLFPSSPLGLLFFLLLVHTSRKKSPAVTAKGVRWGNRVYGGEATASPQCLHAQ